MIQTHVVQRFHVERHLFTLLDGVPNMTTICRQQRVVRKHACEQFAAIL